ncbi:MAG: Thermophilic metalloprotease (M29) superfamily, partial [uncultured bacterium (gcode 4)]
MYTPSQQVLKNYADILIKFALWSWEWMKPGEVIYLQVPESAKLLLIELQKSVLEAGGNYIINYIPEWSQRHLFEIWNDEQINFWPKDYCLEIVKTCDHFLRIESSWDKYELKWIDSKKIIWRQRAAWFYMDARRDKENAGKQTWVVWLFWTEAMAKAAWLTMEEYWNEIIKACFLDEADPIAKWREVFVWIQDIKSKLDDLKIEKVHILWEDADLHIKIGENRKWLGGSGRNIPSFEIFTSPDWRWTNGWIRFNQPLYRYGNRVDWIELKFKDWIITEATANNWEDLLKEMVAAENANKLGEFSLTDRRFSRITKFMWETLYDENVGWEFGNTHVAVWSSFYEAYVWDVANTPLEEFKNMWFNESSIHTDIMSTKNRKVT